MFQYFTDQITEFWDSPLRPRAGSVVRQWDKPYLLSWKQTDFDFTVGQCLVSLRTVQFQTQYTVRWWRQSLFYDSVLCRWELYSSRHNTLSDGNVRACFMTVSCVVENCTVQDTIHCPMVTSEPDVGSGHVATPPSIPTYFHPHLTLTQSPFPRLGRPHTPNQWTPVLKSTKAASLFHDRGEPRQARADARWN